MRHCTFPVPKFLLSGGVGQSWEWLTEVRLHESWKYDAIGKPLWSRAEGRTRLEDARRRPHPRRTSRSATGRSTRGCAASASRSYVHDRISQRQRHDPRRARGRPPLAPQAPRRARTGDRAGDRDVGDQSRDRPRRPAPHRGRRRGPRRSPARPRVPPPEAPRGLHLGDRSTLQASRGLHRGARARPARSSSGTVITAAGEIGEHLAVRRRPRAAADEEEPARRRPATPAARRASSPSSRPQTTPSNAAPRELLTGHVAAQPAERRRWRRGGRGCARRRGTGRAP